MTDDLGPCHCGFYHSSADPAYDTSGHREPHPRSGTDIADLLVSMSRERARAFADLGDARAEIHDLRLQLRDARLELLAAQAIIEHHGFTIEAKP